MVKIIGSFRGSVPLGNPDLPMYYKVALNDLTFNVLDCKTFEHHDSQSCGYDTTRSGPIPAREELRKVKQTEKQKCLDARVEF